MANRRKPVATLRPHESANHPNHEICKANWLKLWKRALFALHAVLGLGCDGIVVIQIHLQQCWSHFWQGEQCKDKSTKCNFSFPHCHLSFHVFCRFDQASSKKHYTASHNVCSLWWSVRPEVSSSCRADTIHFCEPCRWFWIGRWGGASRHLSPQKVRCPVPITVFEPFRWGILSWGIQVGRIPGRGRTERPDHSPRRVADSDSDVSSLKQDVERRANVASMYIESTLQIEPDFFLWWIHYNYHSVTSRCFFFSSRFGWGPPLLKNSSQRLVWSCVGPSIFRIKAMLKLPRLMSYCTWGAPTHRTTYLGNNYVNIPNLHDFAHLFQHELAQSPEPAWHLLVICWTCPVKLRQLGHLRPLPRMFRSFSQGWKELNSYTWHHFATLPFQKCCLTANETAISCM